MIYKLRNAVIIYFLILAAFIVQCSIFPRIGTITAAPNLLLVLAFMSGYSRGKIPGLLTGLFAGLCFDVFFGEVIGFYALIFLLIGYISGIWNKFFYSDNIHIPLILLCCNEFCYCIITFVFRYVMHGTFDFGTYSLKILLPEFFFTLVAGMILYLPLAKLYTRMSADTL